MSIPPLKEPRSPLKSVDSYLVPTSLLIVIRFLHLLIVAFALSCAPLAKADVAFIFQSATDIPVTANGFTATHQTFSATLNFAPPTGTELTVIKNVGSDFIQGQFTNLAQGQTVILTYAGVNYRFLANYYGGNGNDLVLQWGMNRIVGWGPNMGQIAGYIPSFHLVPANVPTDGVLAGKTFLKVAASPYHSLALSSDGKLFSWGANFGGAIGDGGSLFRYEPVKVDQSGVLADKTVVDIATSSYSSFALCSDGTVAAWGDNFGGALGVGAWSPARNTLPLAVDTSGILAGKKVTALSAGEYHTLALCSDGTLVAWGYNDSGQLGVDSEITVYSTNVPTRVYIGGALAGKTVVKISAGTEHSLALCSDGTIVSWGRNYWGQLGNNEVQNSATPVAVDTSGVLSGKTVIAIAAGHSHNLALCSDGTLVTWGTYHVEQPGGWISQTQLTPVALGYTGALAGKTIATIAAGNSCNLVRCTDGTIVTWGVAFGGGLGNNTSFYGSTTPVSVHPGSALPGESYTAVFNSPQGSTTLGLLAAPVAPSTTLLAPIYPATGITLQGIVHSGGQLTTAQFEYGPTTDYGSTASLSLAPADSTFLQTVSADLSHLPFNTVYHYRLTATNVAGTSSTADGTFITPAPPAASHAFTSSSDVWLTANGFVASGHTFAASLSFAPPVGTNLTVVDNTGTEVIRGQFDNLAHGQVVTLSYGGINYRFAANYYGGSGNDLVLQWANTRLVAWGSGLSGQIGDGTGLNRSIPTAVTSTFATAGKSILSTAAGDQVSFTLCSGNTLATWGGSTASTPVVVSPTGGLSGRTIAMTAAGSNHQLALCTDGTVAAWGNNSNGQLGIGNTSITSDVVISIGVGGLYKKHVVSVGAGFLFSAALCSDGTVLAWGANNKGQVGRGSIFSSHSPYATDIDREGVLRGKKIVTMSVGQSSVLTRCSDGTLVTWGSNSNGQLGNGSLEEYSTSPVAVDQSGVLAGKTVVAMSAGATHVLLLCSDGSLVTWGSNSNGQLGIGHTTNSLVPVLVDQSGVLAGKTVISVAAGNLHSVVCCSDGTMVAWGANNYGQVGNNSSVQSTVPVLVDSSVLGPGEKYVSATTAPNANHTVAVVATPPTPAVTNPTGGTMTLTPAATTVPGANMGVSFAGWTGGNLPLSYRVLIDNVIVSPSHGATARTINGPTTAGSHVIKGIVTDAAGNSTEVTQNISVDTSAEGWRTFYFGAPQNDGAAADAIDADGDGLSNAFEFVAALSPTNATSRFSPQVKLVPGHPEQKAIVFGPIVGGRIYTVKYKDGLGDANWQTLTDCTTSDSGAERTVIDLSPGLGLRFYRVEITAP